MVVTTAPAESTPATEWKHAQCALVNRMMRRGKLIAVLWCVVHQELVEDVPL